MNSTVKEDWIALIQSGRAGQKLLDENSLHLYYGADLSGHAVFLLVSSEKSRAPRLSDLIKVEHGRRQDGAWTVVLTLIDLEFLDTFIGMCLELARRTADATGENSALRIFDTTIQQWRRLLTQKGAPRLSDAELRGLVAELWVLRRMGTSVEHDVAVRAWVGPHGAPHDFRLADGEVYEVKSVHTGGSIVHISSVEQLEPELNDQLELVVVTVNDVPGAGAATTTVLELANGITKDLGLTNELIELFHDKLALLDLDLLDSYYSETHFEIVGSRHFVVASNFPRIQAADVPVGVRRVKYELQLETIVDFLTSAAFGTPDHMKDTP